MDKKPLSESDICDKFIRPAMEAAGWNGMDQIYREFPLRAGRVVVRGQKSFRDKTTVVRADYALFHKPNIPLAVVEAKDNSHAMGAGMAQAISAFCSPRQWIPPPPIVRMLACLQVCLLGQSGYTAIHASADRNPPRPIAATGTQAWRHGSSGVRLDEP